MFITHLYSHNDATIKDWDTITLPLQLADKWEYEILGTVGMTLAENTSTREDQETTLRPTPPRRRGNDQVVPRNQSGYPTAASRPVSFPTVDLGVCMRVGKKSIPYHMEDAHHMGQRGKIRVSRAGMMLWSKQSARKTSGTSSVRVTCHPEEKCRPM